MAKRINKLSPKVDSKEVQGEGSWVKLKQPTLNDMQNLGTIGESLEEKLEYSKELLSQFVVEWNWVDDEGEPLPQPTGEIIAELPFQEVQFLLDALNLEGLKDTKKSL